MENGAVLGPFKTDPFFGFHHVNAYDDGDETVFDVAVVDGPQVFDELLMERFVVDGIVTAPVLKRFRVNRVTGRVSHTPLGSGSFDFPFIDERQRGQSDAGVGGQGGSPTGEIILARGPLADYRLTLTHELGHNLDQKKGVTAGQHPFGKTMHPLMQRHLRPRPPMNRRLQTRHQLLQFLGRVIDIKTL